MKPQDTKLIGDITELKCQTAFLELGYEVLVPIGDRCRYDFVATDGKEYIRVQCKTAHSTDNGATFEIVGTSSHYRDGKCVKHKYTADEIDYFATVWLDKCYLVPVTSGNHKILRITPPRSNNQKGINMAEDYEIAKILNQRK